VDAEIRDGELILRFITQNNWFIGRVAVKGQFKSPPNAGQLANASRLELGELQTDEKMNQALEGIQQLSRAMDILNLKCSLAIPTISAPTRCASISR
jgi:hypothetical protein